VKTKVKVAGAKFCFVRHLLREASPRGSSPVVSPCAASLGVGRTFPDSLGPWKMHLASAAVECIEMTKLPTSNGNGAFRVVRDSPLKHMKGIATEGVLGPLSEVNFPKAIRTRLGIPDGEVHYCFAHGLKNAATVMMTDDKFSWCQHDATFTFFILGGFLYFDKDKKLVAILSVTGNGEGEQQINFGSHCKVKEADVPKIISDRLQPVPEGTLLKQKGAEKSTALANGEMDCKFGGQLITMKGEAHVFPYKVT